jgi:probable HAF family extracellular repeat protein
MRIRLIHAVLATSALCVASIASGAVALVRVPGVTFTVARGINDRSQIVGSFKDAAFKTHGFLRTGGQYTTIDVPNADGTEAWGINNLTQIVGSYLFNGQSHGFVLENGRYSTLDPPAATSASAFGINDLGQIVGIYQDSGGWHGYLWTHGRFVTIDLPNPGPSRTEPRGINRSGQIVGYRADNIPYSGSYSGLRHFLLEADGSVTTHPDPFGIRPEYYGINDRGEIVGEVFPIGNATSFLRAFGTETEVLGVHVAYGINNRGQIVGVGHSEDPRVSDGLVYTPPSLIGDVSGIASPDNTRIPLSSVIVDNNLTTWTLGPGEEILHDGAQVVGAYGSQILWYQGGIYVLGDDYNWWRWTGITWTFAGANDPAS